MPAMTGLIFSRAHGGGRPPGGFRAALYQFEGGASLQPGRGFTRTSGPIEIAFSRLPPAAAFHVIEPPAPIRPLVCAAAAAALASVIADTSPAASTLVVTIPSHLLKSRTGAARA